MYTRCVITKFQTLGAFGNSVMFLVRKHLHSVPGRNYHLFNIACPRWSTIYCTVAITSVINFVYRGSILLSSLPLTNVTSSSYTRWLTWYSLWTLLRDTSGDTSRLWWAPLRDFFQVRDGVPWVSVLHMLLPLANRWPCMVKSVLIRKSVVLKSGNRPRQNWKLEIRENTPFP